MSEVLIHLLIPVAALIIAGFDRKLVLIFCPLAVIPDIDVIFGAHRSFLHSLIFLGFFSILFLFYTSRYKPQWKTHAIIISLLLLSHPLLDFITGPVQLLWPIDTYYYLQINPPTFDTSTLSVNFGVFTISLLILSPAAAALIINPTEPITLFSNEGLVALALFGVAILYWLMSRRKASDLPTKTVIQPSEGHS